jgi:hypothetical protein
MASKKRSKPSLRMRNVFWLALVLVLVGLIWRRLLGCLTFVEGLKVPGQLIDVTAYMALITSNMPVDWYAETFVLLCQVAALACLLHVCPLGQERQGDGLPGKLFRKPGIFQWRRQTSGDAGREGGEPQETLKFFTDHIHADRGSQRAHRPGGAPS